MKKHKKPNRFEDGARQSIGDSYVNEACAALNRACGTEAAIFVGRFTAPEVLQMLFNDDAVARLRAAHGLLNYEQTDGQYALRPRHPSSLGLRTHDMPSASPAAMDWHADRAAPFEAALRTLAELQVKWGAVKHMLRWFNRNATPGAVRAIWPSALQLCPTAPTFKELHHSPVRYTNPQGLSEMLPLIRATASTVATMAMLPNDQSPRLRDSVWVTLDERKATYEGVTVNLDSHLFHL